MHVSRPRLYLHLGTHKTGTSALQTFSVANREVLRRHGLYYPDFSPFSNGPKDGHHALAHAFSSKPKRIKPDQAEALIARWHEVAAKSNLTTVISAEAMYRHKLGTGGFRIRRRRYLDRLKAALSEFEVIPVIVFRRPDDYLRSLYQEIVAYPSRPREMPSFMEYISKPPEELNYAANASIVEAVFGRLEVLVYEDLASSPGSLGEAFYAALGYSLSEHQPTAKVRTSLSPEETQVKNALNGELTSRSDSKIFVELLRTPIMQAALRKEYPHPPYSLWPNIESRQTFLESRAEDLAQIKKHYFPERKDLFLTEVDGELYNPVPQPSAQLMEQAIECVRKKHN